MRKEIKRWGNSLVIRLTPEECMIYGSPGKPLSQGDIIDIDIHRIFRSKK